MSEITNILPDVDTEIDLYPCQEDDKWGFCDKDRNLVIFYKYDSAESFSEGLALVRLNGNHIFIDKFGKEIEIAYYEFVNSFSNGYACVIKHNEYIEKINQWVIGQYGFIDKNGKEVISCKYDVAYDFYEGFANVKQQTGWYIIDKNEKIVSQEYEYVSSVNKGFAEVRLNGKKKWIYLKDNEFVSFKYDASDGFTEGLANVELNGKWGFIDESGKEIISCKYDTCGSFFEGVAKIELNHKWGLIDKLGQEVVSCKYDYITYFSEGFAIAFLNSKIGFIDKTGKITVEFIYDNANSFHEGLAKVELNGKCGFIDYYGNEVISLKFDVLERIELDYGESYSIDNEIGNFIDGVAHVKLKGKCGLIDKTGKVICDFIYDEIWNFNGGSARFRLNSKFGYIDKTGKELPVNQYDEIGCFSEELARVKLNGKFGFINKKGEEVIRCNWDNANYFCEGLSRVQGENNIKTASMAFADKEEERFWLTYNGGISYEQILSSHKFIDKIGKVIIDCSRYEWTDRFIEGLAIVRQYGKCGLIDKTGHEVIGCKYDKIGNFKNDLALVYKKPYWGLIDKSGLEVIECRYSEIQSFNESLSLAKQNGKFGLIDHTGKEVVDFKYDMIWSFNNELALVEHEHKYGLIYMTGQVILACKYNSIESYPNELIALVNRNRKWGVFDVINKELIACKSDNGPDTYREGITRIKRYRELGFVDKNNIDYMDDPDFLNVSDLKPQIEWITIPAGTFIMGSQKNEFDRGDDEILHTVTLKGYRISKYEITFEQYRKFSDFVGRTHLDPKCWSLRRKRPVTNVTWEDAKAFADWIDCRLPTEAEWEYACRAGTSTPFNTGNNLNTLQSNCKCDEWERTMPVGSYAPNAWGIYDMHGNVWEWCNDFYGIYQEVAQTNPQGPKSGLNRVCRGGSLYDDLHLCRSAKRYYSAQTFCSYNLGFRLVSCD